MALLKTEAEVETLREGGKRLAAVLRLLGQKAGPGISTWELEELAQAKIKKAGAEPAFLSYSPDKSLPPYPAAICASVNNEVVHSTPDKKKILWDGDVVSIDLGIKYQGLYTDAAITVGVGKISDNATRLIAGAREALAAGIVAVKAGNTIGDIAAAIEAVGKRYKLGVIRDLVGHGVGHAIHEPPSIPNYGKAGTLEKLESGMVLAIEPMFTLGDWRIKFYAGQWRVTTADGSLAAHFEHTVAVTQKGCIILTE